MFVFFPGSIPPVRFGTVGTDPPDGSISPVTYITYYLQEDGDKTRFFSGLAGQLDSCPDNVARKLLNRKI